MSVAMVVGERDARSLEAVSKILLHLSSIMESMLERDAVDHLDLLRSDLDDLKQRIESSIGGTG